MNRKKIIAMALVVFMVVALGVGAFYFLKIKSKPDEKSPILAEKNYFEINDEASGISFKISKKFERVPARDLQVKNTSFIYGFSALDDKTVVCYISQTQRDKPGIVTVANLRDGVFKQVQKTFADARLDSAEIADVGENNNKGARLKISYTDANIPKFQWEVAGITDKTTSFAFCEFPQAVIDLYERDVNLFLDSIKIR